MASPTSTSPMPAACSSMVTAVAVGPSRTKSAQGRISREYQVDLTRLDTSGSTQLDSADRRFGASDLRKSPMHAEPGPRSAAAMVWHRRRAAAASPPHLRRSPPSSSASISNWLKTVSRRLLSSSAPSRPRRASRSVSGVKPVMSKNSRLPSTTRWAGPAQRRPKRAAAEARTP